jgi:signal transduction histidine kinase/DNA-binding response OmpR family regulator
MPQALTLALHHDSDVVIARHRAGHLAHALGFDLSEQTRIATAVSEIVRNAFRYATHAVVDFRIDTESRPQRLVVRVSDRGPGIPRLDDVLSGRFQSTTGMGIGIQGARRLMDRFSIQSSPDGTTVVLEKFLPQREPLVTHDRLNQIAEAIARRQPASLVEEIQRQNQDLLRALDELQRKQQELLHVNRELEDTNRGVVALYAELDEKADHLRRADELKSRFLSNMTHEFRTPVNSIIGLTRLLIDDRNREGREPEQELTYIRDAADQLSELVNDLLDLAKVEAGKTVVRPVEFHVETLFGALRGMLRPLLLNQSVALVFEGGEGLPALYTDEGKLSQILRNLISNGLKFTEGGEVRISARTDASAGTILFEVSDTGIGIRAEDIPRLFSEFTQIEQRRLKRNVKGTGLGLALSKGLVELLGGTLSVKSEPGVGSTFAVRIPTHYRPPLAAPFEWIRDPTREAVLVIEDAAEAQYFYEKALASTPFQVYPARTLREAELALTATVPAVVILDILMGDQEAWDVLLRLKREERLSNVPVVVVSALPEREKAALLGADAYLPKPLDKHLLLETLEGLPVRRNPIRVLTIDDDEATSFLVRQCLPHAEFDVRQAATGEEGLAMARAEPPQVILLDLVMPPPDGYEVLAQLRRDDRTRGIPVVILTSAALDRDARSRLRAQADEFLSKADLSRETVTSAVREVIRGYADRRDTGEPAKSFPI